MMTTRDEMVRTLGKFCDEQKDCDGCLIEKFSDARSCDFNEWGDSALVVAYNRVCKNSEARLDGSHLNTDETYDMVSNPKHYNQGGVECIECIKSATVGKKGIEAVCVANVIKYLFRYEEKNGVEDVRKARWYLERLLKELEGQQD